MCKKLSNIGTNGLVDNLNNQINGEVFFQEDIDGTFSVYGFIYRYFDELDQKFQLLEGAVDTEPALFSMDMAETLDKVLYRNNQIIKMLERSLSS